MAVYDKYFSRAVVEKAWQQIQESLISEDGRLRQLFALKPIDLYNDNADLKVNGAEVKLDIKSYLENLIQKRAKRGFNILRPFKGFSVKDVTNYKFNVVVNGKMDFKNIETWVRNTFKDVPYSFDEDRYILKLRDVVQIASNNKKLAFKLDIFGSVRFWKFRFKTKSLLSLVVDPYYDAKTHYIKVKDIDYKFETANLILKVLDKFYHNAFKDFLRDSIEIGIEEDLFYARTQAQDAMNEYQQTENLVFNGYLNDLELERFEVQPKGLEAVFLAQGNIQLTA